MIREDDEDIAGIPARLRDAATDALETARWDVPGLLSDAAERIEWLERANAELVGDQKKSRVEQEALLVTIAEYRDEFNQHSEAAQALYADIYRVAVGATGERIPDGCTPLGAVKLVSAALTRAREQRNLLQGTLARSIGNIEIAEMILEAQNIRCQQSKIMAAIAPFARVAPGIPHNWPGRCVLNFEQSTANPQHQYLSYLGEVDEPTNPTIDDWRELGKIANQ